MAAPSLDLTIPRKCCWCWGNKHSSFKNGQMDVEMSVGRLCWAVPGPSVLALAGGAAKPGHRERTALALTGIVGFGNVPGVGHSWIADVLSSAVLCVATAAREYLGMWGILAFPAEYGGWWGNTSMFFVNRALF